MPERTRANRLVTRLFVGEIVAVLILVLAVFLLETRTRASITNSQHLIRDQQNEQLRLGCARGVRRDSEAYQTNRDFSMFARDAAAARRRSHQLKLARAYDERAGNAESRMRSIKLRLPDVINEASINSYCRELYPLPGS